MYYWRGGLSITYALFVVLLFSLVHMSICLGAFESYVNIVVEVGDDGVVQVFISLTLDEGLHRVELPVEPIVPTIMASINGNLIPIAYVNKSIYLILNSPSNVTIEYVANVTIVDGIFQLSILSDDVVKVVFPLTTVLLTWPEENILDAKVTQNKLALYLRGPSVLKYIIKTPTTPPQTPPTEPYTTASLPNIYVVLAVVASVAIVITFTTFTYLRRRERGLSDILGDVDKAIIRALEVRGGSALQAELQNDIKLPKTTLWRHVKKLERLGMVKVEKVGTQNKVILVKKIKS